MRRTSSTQAQTRRSNRAKKTVGLASLFFPNALNTISFAKTLVSDVLAVFLEFLE